MKNLPLFQLDTQFRVNFRAFESASSPRVLFYTQAGRPRSHVINYNYHSHARKAIKTNATTAAKATLKPTTMLNNMDMIMPAQIPAIPIAIAVHPS